VVLDANAPTILDQVFIYFEHGVTGSSGAYIMEAILISLLLCGSVAVTFFVLGMIYEANRHRWHSEKEAVTKLL